MFGLFKKKTGGQDPLSDLSTVSRWVQNLPMGDIYSAQEQVVQNLIQFNHAKQPMSKERLAVLLHLDEQSRDLQHSLCLQYLRNPRMSRVIESRLWTAIHAYYWEVTRGYHAFLMDFVANPGGSRIQSLVPLITARAMRGFADIFKWRYFRYEKVDEKLWLRLHNLYRIAEFDGFDKQQFKVYAGDAHVSSCEAEYLRALLLSPLGSGRLLPRQLEMVDQWLGQWAHLVELAKAYDPQRHHFYVDVSQGTGLRRVQGETNSNHRYVALDRLLAHIDSIKASLKTGGTPAALGLGEDFRLPEGYDLLDLVRAEWSASSGRDRRRSARQAENSRWEVVRDLVNIHHKLREEQAIVAAPGRQTGLTPEELLDIKLYGFVTERTKAGLQQRATASVTAQVIERWPLQDRSEHGVCLLLRAEDNDWLKVGRLLALRPDPAEDWHLGLIRRIARVDESWRRVGVEYIGRKPRMAVLEQDAPSTLSYVVDDDSDLTPSSQTYPALLLDYGQANLLVLESARYGHGRTYRLKSDEAAYRIRLDSVRERGDGWLMVTYTVLG
ncbi:MAG: hypothetical protein N2Z63_01695 [Thiobacillaceae bacterium]|nr:hypothetical protein [Thiobacillaceae bacterium]